ncbi:MAG: hypothetical protein HXS44_06145 [Theionarchaea archaeon]|nr:hypothetical protein [Theionarchaea archaeon]
MKKICVILSILLVSLIPQGALHAQGHRIMTATMKTESGTRTVEVRHYAESEAWAKDILRTIREGFPLLEERIGVPCPVSYDILVIETSSLKPGVAAVNRGSDGMLVPTGTPTYIIIHELCHYWFGWLPSTDWSNWIKEGFPEAYTIFLLQELDDPEGYNHFYSRLYQYETAKKELGDAPLSEVGYSPDFEDTRVDMLYSKAAVYCMWLLLYFGEDYMHKINEQTISLTNLRTEDYQAVLEEITGQELDWLFSGWVYPGEYYYEGKKVSFEWFAGDGDKDGISTLDEIQKGSSPLIGDTDKDGLPDGYELMLKTDLDNPDTDNDGLHDGDEVHIIIDGKNTEWKTPLIEDAKDSESPEPQDIKAVYYTVDDKYVYFMIEFYNSINTAHRNGMLIDTDGDDYAEFMFFLWYDHLSLGIWEDDTYSAVYDPESLKNTFAVSDTVVELMIPKRMRHLQLPDKPMVWAREFYVPDGITTDQSYSHSISVNRSVKSTNPLNPDTDSDGLKDGEDPNPLSADVAEPEDTEVPETEPPELSEDAEVAAEEPPEPDTDIELQETESQRGEENLEIFCVGALFLAGVVVSYLVLKRRHSSEQSTAEET